MASSEEKQLLTRDPFPLGSGLEIRWVEIAKLKEQDLNPQVMQPAEFERLTENIREKGMVESLPYLWDPPDGPVEIVSGHHRSRAARNAGLAVIPAIVDTTSMTRSEVASKQIAHNALVGQTDDALLAQLLKDVSGNVNDLLRTGLDPDKLPTIDALPAPVGAPGTKFDFRVITFTFLPHQLTDFERVIEQIPPTDLLGVAAMDQYDGFVKAVAEYIRIKDVRHIGTVVARLTQAAETIIEEESNGD